MAQYLYECTVTGIALEEDFKCTFKVVSKNPWVIFGRKNVTKLMVEGALVDAKELLVKHAIYEITSDGLRLLEKSECCLQQDDNTSC